MAAYPEESIQQARAPHRPMALDLEPSGPTAPSQAAIPRLLPHMILPACLPFGDQR